MSRARSLKPGFFKNEELADLPFEYRILFQGLWCLADRSGRMEDRPKRIKAEVFPYDSVDADAGLNALQAAGFIVRYEAAGAHYIEVLNFGKHQNPHVKEAASTIPVPGTPATAPVQHRARTVQAPEIPERAGLTPDSLNPIPYSKKEQASPSGSRLPLDWQFPDDWREWAQAERPGILIHDEAAKFADYWHGVAGAKGRKADWLATWRNWIRNSRAVGNQRAGPVQAAPGKTMQALIALEEMKNGLGNARTADRFSETDLPQLGTATGR